MICNRFFTYTCVKLFLESKKKEINSFASHFKASVLPEERVRALVVNPLSLLLHVTPPPPPPKNCSVNKLKGFIYIYLNVSPS